MIHVVSTVPRQSSDYFCKEMLSEIIDDGCVIHTMFRIHHCLLGRLVINWVKGLRFRRMSLT